jgi:hypothetical protein
MDAFPLLCLQIWRSLIHLSLFFSPFYSLFSRKIIGWQNRLWVFVLHSWRQLASWSEFGQTRLKSYPHLLFYFHARASFSLLHRLSILRECHLALDWVNQFSVPVTRSLAFSYERHEPNSDRQNRPKITYSPFPRITFPFFYFYYSSVPGSILGFFGDWFCLGFINASRKPKKRPI